VLGLEHCFNSLSHWHNTKTQHCCPQVCNARLATANCCCCCVCAHPPRVFTIYGVADWSSGRVGLLTRSILSPLQRYTIAHEF